MIARCVISCCAGLLAVVPARAWSSVPECAHDSFAAAAFVPADVTAYIDIAEGAKLRQELARYPFGAWVTGWTISPDLALAWQSLAKSARVTTGQLFDATLGKQFTLVVRGTGVDADWAIISTVDRRGSEELLKRISPRLVDFWKGVSVFDLPEQQLYLARHEDTLLIGPKNNGSKLFSTICKAMATDLANPLADDVSFQQAQELGDGSLFAFVRKSDVRQATTRRAGGQLIAHRSGVAKLHSEWNAISSVLAEGELKIRHASSSAAEALAGDAQPASWDMRPLMAIGETGALALIKPFESHEGLIEKVVEQGLGDTTNALTVAHTQTGRRILIIGETHTTEMPGGAIVPVVSQVFELECDEAAVQQATQALQVANARIMNLDSGAYLKNASAPNSVRIAIHHRLEHVEDETSSPFRGMPVMDPIPLQWTVTNGEGGSWCVVSNCRADMTAIAHALAKAHDEAPNVGPWVSCGSGDGTKLVEALRSLANSTDMLSPAVQELLDNQAVTQITDIASVVERFSWALSRDADGRQSLEVALRLAERRRD